jgi:uncharacterized membrane protein YadS
VGPTTISALSHFAHFKNNSQKTIGTAPQYRAAFDRHRPSIVRSGGNQMMLFFIIVFAIIAAVATVGELRRPTSPLHWSYANKAEKWFLIGSLAAFGLLLYAAAR